MLEDPAREISDADLDLALASGYGIFAGSLTQTAVLRFSASAARWVARERWHSSQTGSHDAGGAYILRVPYSHDAELIRDLLRYGSDVEVVEPKALRDEMRTRLEQALRNY